MNTIKCLNCGYENKNTNIRCESCGLELKHVEQNNNFLNTDYYQDVKAINLGSKKSKLVIRIILIVIFAPWLFFGLAFIGVSLFLNISYNNKSKNYLETNGYLINYENCKFEQNGEELCNAIYEYTVDDVTYKVSPKLLNNRSGFNEIEIIMYNPDNPNEYIMYSGWNELLIIGIIIVSIVVVILSCIKRFINGFSKKTNDIEKDNT